MNAIPLSKLAKNASRKFHFDKYDKVVFINTGDVLNNEFLHNKLSEKDTLPGQAKKSIKKGDILYSEIRPGNGRYLFVNKDLDNYVVSTKFMVIEANQDLILPEYLFLILTSSDVTEYFKVIAEARSGTFPQITFDAISHYEINTPNKVIQKEIVDYIFSLDKKIQLNTQTNQTLEAIAQAIFKSWFVDFDPVRAKAQAILDGKTNDEANLSAMAVISGKAIEDLSQTEYQELWEIADAFPSELVENSEFGEVPKGWEVRKVGEIANFIKGKKPKQISNFQENEMLPHILVAGLSGKYSEFAPIEKAVICQNKETLILMDGSGSGKISIGHNGVVGSTLAKLNLNNEKYWAIIHLLLKNKELDIQQHTTGTSIPHTDKTRVLNYDLIIPCDVILNWFNGYLENTLHSILTNRNKNFSLEKIRDELLPKLLSGEPLNE